MVWGSLRGQIWGLWGPSWGPRGLVGGLKGLIRAQGEGGIQLQTNEQTNKIPRIQQDLVPLPKSLIWLYRTIKSQKGHIYIEYICLGAVFFLSRFRIHSESRFLLGPCCASWQILSFLRHFLRKLENDSNNYQLIFHGDSKTGLRIWIIRVFIFDLSWDQIGVTHDLWPQFWPT